MKKIITASLGTALLLASCSNDEPLYNMSQNNDIRSTNPYHIPVYDAIKTANSMMSDIEGINTRSNTRIIDNISVIRNSQKTRSNENVSDTLLYIINYSDNKGFAIVSADSRSIPVYAISDTGHFELTDETNPAVSNMLKYAEASVMSYTNRNSSETQSGWGSNLTPGPSPLDSTIRWEGLTPYKKIEPMISPYQNRIYPTPQLSKYVINDYGEPARTSCVPVAAELMMSYYWWPERLEGYYFNWRYMNIGRLDDSIARLLGILTSKKYIHVTGNDANEGGGASYLDIIPTFEKCGYERPGNFKNFYGNETEAIESLDNGPLFLRASSADPELPGHIWIVDGLLQYQIGKNVEGLKYPVIELYTYYHCVWGDGGTCNGYYLVADHGFNGAPDMHDAVDSGDDSGAKWRYYSKNIVFLGNLKPIRQ